MTSEGDLIALCLGLMGKSPELTVAEHALCDTATAAHPLLNSVKAQIAAGSDPLGEMFLQLRSAEQRRPMGATYTPACIVAAMVRWAADQGVPARIVDPGAGSGRFLTAAAEAFPEARLVGIERDPLAALMLRANLSARGLSDRASIVVGDYQSAEIGDSRGPTLFIGNPPYVRHHQIANVAKKWFGEASKALGFPSSKLAGLHVHFFVRTAQLAKAGDFGALITSAEWLDVNYGKALRSLLAGKLRGVALYVLDAKAMPFADAMTTGAITCFHAGSRRTVLRVRNVKTVDKLNRLGGGKPVAWKEVQKLPRWSVLLRPLKEVPSGYVELGELCRVHRGQVTGNNAVWIEGPHTNHLPNEVLFPAVTRGRELLLNGETLETADGLRRVVDLPADLEALTPQHRRAALSFLEYAKAIGAHQGYIARHRRAWWSVGLREAAPILVSYMARRAPMFTRNLCGARHINIAHGLYPRVALDNRILDALAHWLRHNVSVDSGRTYAGGLTKFEPREIERILVPSPDALMQ